VREGKFRRPVIWRSLPSLTVGLLTQNTYRST
jgi:hypothetical protein